MNNRTYWQPVKVVIRNGFIHYTKTKYECGFCKKIYEDKIAYCPNCNHYMKKKEKENEL